VTQMDREDWRSELALHDELFGKIGAHLPKALEARRGRMHEKLAA
jgi:GTP-dependent phosphoenolpyruvate carboxykinase